MNSWIAWGIIKDSTDNPVIKMNLAESSKFMSKTDNYLYVRRWGVNGLEENTILYNHNLDEQLSEEEFKKVLAKRLAKFEKWEEEKGTDTFTEQLHNSADGFGYKNMSEQLRDSLLVEEPLQTKENGWKIPQSTEHVVSTLPMHSQVEYWKQQYQDAMNLIEKLLATEIGSKLIINQKDTTTD